MSYYATPAYVGLSCLLSLIYASIECVKDNGTLDNATHSILCGWCIVSMIVGSVILGVTGEMAMGISSMPHILIALILACVTLSISSSIIYWSS